MAEAFAALLTRERFLAAVQPFVLRQMMFVLERFVADVAGKRSLTWNTNIKMKPCANLF
jgi:hypothetical protein